MPEGDITQLLRNEYIIQQWFDLHNIREWSAAWREAVIFVQQMYPSVELSVGYSKNAKRNSLWGKKYEQTFLALK
jgi:hypothetical protein